MKARIEAIWCGAISGARHDSVSSASSRASASAAGRSPSSPGEMGGYPLDETIE
ncbi:MAG TPA: hypothetical protein VGQ90_10430 [Stellaceae bacterium]|nr:hypothetical protein [Stellaceae bacterium]